MPHDRRQPLTRNVSLFIDLLRLFAALLVLVGHAGEVYRLDLPDTVEHSAKEGVAIFFVLSGFVIAFVTARKEHDWRAFALARSLRMYSVVPLALLVMLVCYFVGAAVRPEVYGVGPGGANAANPGAFGSPPDAWTLLRYITFSNELWFDRSVISTGAPFWSLGFEVSYYVGFAVLFYARGGWRWALALAWLLACGPRIAVAFPLWLVGVVAWKGLERAPRLRPLAGIASLASILLLALAWRRWVAFVAVPLFEWPDSAALLASLAYYLVLGMLVALAIVVFGATAPVDRSIWPRGMERIIRYCAGASFTIYIAHLPVMVLLAALWPGTLAHTAAGLAASGLTLALMFPLAAAGERRKASYARWIERWVPRREASQVCAMEGIKTD
ncbi:acyltransferase family protein [Novosphingobium soli]|uniref:Acyltransferase family protein n=1 Tax=Novosphingobium soli TaxID=574956 RepID=A0ABV6CQ17_9SPHN